MKQQLSLFQKDNMKYQVGDEVKFAPFGAITSGKIIDSKVKDGVESYYLEFHLNNIKHVGWAKSEDIYGKVERTVEDSNLELLLMQRVLTGIETRKKMHGDSSFFKAPSTIESRKQGDWVFTVYPISVKLRGDFPQTYIEHHSTFLELENKPIWGKLSYELGDSDVDVETLKDMLRRTYDSASKMQLVDIRNIKESFQWEWTLYPNRCELVFPFPKGKQITILKR